MSDRATAWPHAPTHRLCSSGTFIVTAGTYQKDHHFKTTERLDVLQRGLLTVAAEFGWNLEAWAIFSNHYHFIAHSPETGAETLEPMLRKLHSKTSIWLNRPDKTPNRKVWHNYWETRLTFERSYLTRLNYVHQNPVKHGLVPTANQYPWCSAAWFERTASATQVRNIYRFKTDQLNVLDEFEPIFPFDA